MPDEQLTNLGSKGIGEPPIVPIAAAIANAIRDATGADVRSLPITREEMLRALAEAAARATARGSPSDARDRASARHAGEPRRARRAGPVLIAGGTEVVPQLAGRAARRRTRSSTSPASCRAGSRATTIGAGTTLAEIEASAAVPGGAARGLPARRLAAAPRDGHGRRQPAPVDALLVLAARLPVPPARRRPLPRPRGRAPRARDLRQRLLRLGAPVRRRRRRCSRSARRVRTNRRELPVADALPAARRGRPRRDALEPGEVLLELEVPPADASVYLKAMDRKRFGFPLVGVAAARRGGDDDGGARRRGAGAVAARGRARRRRRRFPAPRTRSRSRRRSCHARSLPSTAE